MSMWPFKVREPSRPVEPYTNKFKREFLCDEEVPPLDSTIFCVKCGSQGPFLKEYFPKLLSHCEVYVDHIKRVRVNTHYFYKECIEKMCPECSYKWREEVRMEGSDE